MTAPDHRSLPLRDYDHQPPSGGSPVRPETAGPAAHPPPHGNLAQPGKPKADRYGAYGKGD